MFGHSDARVEAMEKERAQGFRSAQGCGKRADNTRAGRKKKDLTRNQSCGMMVAGS